VTDLEGKRAAYLAWVKATRNHGFLLDGPSQYVAALEAEVERLRKRIEAHEALSDALEEA
jgi:hypothetical protein